jgi:hypothetical protein
MYRRGEGAIDAALGLRSPSNALVELDCAGLAGTLFLATSAIGFALPFQLPYQLFRFASDASVNKPFGVFNEGFLVSFDVVEGRKDCDAGTSMAFELVD